MNYCANEYEQEYHKKITLYSYNDKQLLSNIEIHRRMFINIFPE